MACKTEGATSLGPGPIKWRTGGSKGLGISIAPDNVKNYPKNNEFGLLQMHDALANGVDGGFGSVFGVEFEESRIQSTNSRSICSSVLFFVSGSENTMKMKPRTQMPA